MILMNEDRRLWWEAYKAALAGFCHRPALHIDDAMNYCIDAADMAIRALAIKYEDPLDPPWTGHARVELMGHRSYLGRIREIEAYGTRLGEVEELLPSGEYGDVHQFGGKSVYVIQPIQLEAALKELRPTRHIYCFGCSNHEFSLNWGEPLYDSPDPIMYCDQCKETGEDKEEPEGTDLPFDIKIGEVHGPEKCPHTCSECFGEHHWLEVVPDPDDPEDEYNQHDAAVSFDLDCWMGCKHCDAWAEIAEDNEGDS
jgi:hypothetical protein